MHVYFPRFTYNIKKIDSRVTDLEKHSNITLI